jgi:hypothetical protein
MPLAAVLLPVPGLLATVNERCLEEHACSRFLIFATRSKIHFLIASFLMIMVTSLAVGALLSRLSPEAAGSGIPQLKAAYWKELGYVPIKPVVAPAASLMGITFHRQVLRWRKRIRQQKKVPAWALLREVSGADGLRIPRYAPARLSTVLSIKDNDQDEASKIHRIFHLLK